MRLGVWWDKAHKAHVLELVIGKYRVMESYPFPQLFGALHRWRRQLRAGGASRGLIEIQIDEIRLGLSPASLSGLIEYTEAKLFYAP